MIAVLADLSARKNKRASRAVACNGSHAIGFWWAYQARLPCSCVYWEPLHATVLRVGVVFIRAICKPAAQHQNHLARRALCAARAKFA